MGCLFKFLKLHLAGFVVCCYFYVEFFYKIHKNKCMFKKDLLTKSLAPKNIIKVLKDNRITLRTIELPLNIIAADLKKI